MICQTRASPWTALCAVTNANKDQALHIPREYSNSTRVGTFHTSSQRRTRRSPTSKNTPLRHRDPVVPPEILHAPETVVSISNARAGRVNVFPAGANKYSRGGGGVRLKMLEPRRTILAARVANERVAWKRGAVWKLRASEVPVRWRLIKTRTIPHTAALRSVLRRSRFGEDATKFMEEYPAALGVTVNKFPTVPGSRRGISRLL